MSEKRDQRIIEFSDTINQVASGKVESNIKSEYVSWFKRECSVKVFPLDTVSAIHSMKGAGKTAVLNMASNNKPGGGVYLGHNAQEEALFRCSDLFKISKEFYPIQAGDLIYSENVSFFKAASGETLKEPTVVDVITLPAINLNVNSYYDQELQKWIDGKIDPPVDYYDDMKNRMVHLFQTAYRKGVSTLILGAWGCGVYKNDPADVAYAFNEVIIEYMLGKYFSEIIFAIINDENAEKNNFAIFKAHLEK